MRIAIDARELEGRPTGVGRCLDETLRAWASAPDTASHDFILYSRSPFDLAPYMGLHPSVRVFGGANLLWEQITLPRLLRHDAVDVLFAPGYTAPLLTSVPVVLMVHDVSFASHPEWFSWREGARRRTVTRLAARRAAAVVTVSRFSKMEIESHLGIDPSRIRVVPNGVTRMAAAAGPRTPGSVLFVGSIFNRRHVPDLIRAIGILVRRGDDVRLDIIGDNRTLPRLDLRGAARTAGVDDRVRIREWVPDSVLAECYAQASAFAFVSDYEGFGLTPLEALSAGVPPVVLDVPPAREVYQACAVYVDRPEPAAIAAALSSALFDATTRAQVLSGAEALLSRHAWANAADQLLRIALHAGQSRHGQ